MHKRKVNNIQMGISDIIAGFIDDVIRESEGTAELRRGELASRFNCVPSQINYVISTRFSPERGYIVESRRGGSGYIRIRRIPVEAGMLKMHTINTVGETLDADTAAALITNLRYEGALSETETELIAAAVSNNSLRALQGRARDAVRAGIFKNMLMHTKQKTGKDTQ